MSNKFKMATRHTFNLDMASEIYYDEQGLYTVLDVGDDILESKCCSTLDIVKETVRVWTGCDASTGKLAFADGYLDKLLPAIKKDLIATLEYIEGLEVEIEELDDGQ
jgi:hypothetical protein